MENMQVSEGFHLPSSPWQPAFCSWAFNLKRDGDEIRAVWGKIPDDTDILITHGPPYGILDSTDLDDHVGCRALLSRVQAIRPKLHVFGHIHEGHGKEQVDEQSTIFVNASICDGRGKAVQSAIVVELGRAHDQWQCNANVPVTVDGSVFFA